MSNKSQLEKKQSAQDSIIVGWTIRVRGTVQGVGFRPTVYKLAGEQNITGQVLNDGDGVVIEAWAQQSALSAFVQSIRDNAPPLARIQDIEHDEIDGSAQGTIAKGFSIAPSISGSAQTDIAADAATCAACIEDVLNPFSRRFRYPFTNCTDCGPRLSIIKSIPYDRKATSMSVFKMCSQCQTEYNDPLDRRFHAQPNACHACGPKAWLERSDGRTLCIESLTQLDDVEAAASLIQQGEIVAIKGIGGFHLACDATNEEAVAKLRARKRRFHKPFALMARDMQVIKQHCVVSEQEAELLQHHSAPIVVLAVAKTGHETKSVAPSYSPSNADLIEPATGASIGVSIGVSIGASIGASKGPSIGASIGASKGPSIGASIGPAIAAGVAPEQNTLGFMLPYTPLHHLLLKQLNKPIVLTSGNRSDEPQCIDNDDAKERLGEIADYFLFHNREIVNRLDDSVVRVMAGAPILLRRARGYAPVPIPLPTGFEAAPEVIALGGELKNTFCILKKSKAVISQHMGDLEEARSWADYQRNLSLYKQCFQHQPERIAIDLHPEYLSSKMGRASAEEKALPLDEIQHHHAHIASCLADNAWPLDGGPVMGVALDGLGYGCDGTFWGGEFLLCDYSSFERLGTFKPVAMLGGAQAIREPWRNTYAHLMAEMGWPRYKLDYEDLELTAFFESKPLATLNSMLSAQINSPLSSSCGRLFDAVAAAIGICRDHATYEGQAAVELESIVCMETLANETEGPAYPFAVPRLGGKGLPYIEPLAVWQAVLGDLLLDTPKAVMAARFHKGLTKAIVHLVTQLCTRDDERWLNTVALSGGVFQNKILLESVVDRLCARGFRVLRHQQVPPNDGGLSLGQALISAATHLEKEERSHVSWHTWSNS
jgi:hydrogenase maturation protein HypF